MRLEIESNVSLSQCLCCGSYDIVRQSWLRVLRNVVCFPSKSRHSVSVVSLLQRKRQCQAFLCEESAGPTCFAPTQTGTLTQNITTIKSEFPWCEIKTGALSFALPASKRILNAMMSRTIVTQVQAEVQAAFDRDTFGFCCQEKESIVATCCHNAYLDSSLLRWGCREQFVSGCWHSLLWARPRSLLQECWLSTLGVLHPGVPVMLNGHIRDLFPTAEGCMGSRVPNVTLLHWAQQKQCTGIM